MKSILAILVCLLISQVAFGTINSCTEKGGRVINFSGTLACQCESDFSFINPNRPDQECSNEFYAKPERQFQLAGMLSGLWSGKKVKEKKCSRERIARLANEAAAQENQSKRTNKLLGKTICNRDTRIGKYPCYNACAKVASIVLNKAGCGSVTNGAGALWSRLIRKGWKLHSFQRAGCLIGMNSNFGVSTVKGIGNLSFIKDRLPESVKHFVSGKPARARLTKKGINSKDPVYFRHVALATGTLSSIDNDSLGKGIHTNEFFSISTIGDAVKYSLPLILCPPKSADM